MSTPILHSYFGGKNRIGVWIKDFIPKDIKRYIEPFAGSFAIYFLSDISQKTEIIFNDLNKDQANLVACSKDTDNFHDYLKHELEDPNGILYCKDIDDALVKAHYKELYYKLKNSNFRNESFNIPDMKRASQYAFLLTSAFSSCSYTAAGFSGFKLKTFLRKLENKDLKLKLHKIDKIEVLGYEELINKYDSADSFIYLDPPYNSVEKKGSDDQRAGWYGKKDEFGQTDHIKLLEMLKNTKSRWALSYYYFPALEEYLPKDKFTWLEKDFFRSSASFSDTKTTKGTELLILNYDPNHITSNTIKSEKLVDEIEEENDGAFIAGANFTSDESIESVKEWIAERKEEIKEEIREIKEEIREEIKEIKEDIDDFWN